MAMGNVRVHIDSIMASLMHYAYVSLKKSSSVLLNFLFGMFRIAIMVDASLACRLEIERRTAFRLEMIDQEENEDCGYELEGIDSPSHGAILNVGWLMDIYITEIAPDPYLSLDKFTTTISVLPDYARASASNTVRVSNFEQLGLKNALSGSSGYTFVSQKISSGLTSAAMSPKDTYASLRRENRELKLEISRMRVRLNDLEKKQVFMK
ncbi:hypothetical protein HAX54_008018 [Datura stramonium]|uniref:NPH3 domain-containing protein n=1 Tax=Datura stramonium TaxID=4076 RepID=A0ABS8TCJ0_DATST|nr:hypothetical protein [Datura stramonium]